jgi:hypothetical protein
MHRLRLLAIPVALLLITWPALAAKRPAGDLFWTAPDLGAYPMTSIAMLSPATYDGSLEARQKVETAVGQALRGSGHRWVSPFLVRDLMLRAGGDSLGRAINDKLLKEPRVDSLDAPYVCRVLRVRAVLSVRVDQLERRELEPGQSGRPSTTAQLRAALVDSTGRLLWTAVSNETMEGAVQDANANVIGVKVSGLNNTGIGNTTAAPAYHEVLNKIATRWRDAFPRRAAADSTRTGS